MIYMLKVYFKIAGDIQQLELIGYRILEQPIKMPFTEQRIEGCICYYNFTSINTAVNYYQNHMQMIDHRMCWVDQV